MFWIKNPNLIYIGVAKNIFTFPLFDSQASYAAKVISEEISIPDETEMKAELESKREVMLKIPDAMLTFKFQSDYIKELNSVTGWAKGVNPDDMNANYCQFNLNKFENVWDFRNKTHLNLKTGEPSPVLAKRWAERMDDGMEAYFNDLN